METIYSHTVLAGERIAVPYYGNLTDPRTGLANLFFLANTRGEQSLELSVWDVEKHPRLADWFRAERVSGLLCREKDHHQMRELQKEGIWVVGGGIGEAEEIFADWLVSLGGDRSPDIPQEERVFL